MGVGSGGQGASLDFHTWNRYSRQRLNSTAFWPFFRCPPLLEENLPTPLTDCNYEKPCFVVTSCFQVRTNIFLFATIALRGTMMSFCVF